MENRRNTEKELDRSIDHYLSNKSALPSKDFNDLVMREIENLPSLMESERRKIPFLLPFSVTAFVACLLFILMPRNSKEYSGIEKSKVLLHQYDTSPQLKEPEKELIEELMVIPEKWIKTETFPDEQTYELLVLLDI